ncbi:sialidase family protein [Aphanothece sacrum]|uniref:exo-alpha-sialidase n=1 Tax=Aphanothece sacrum FPU1 TaxID=1920663 RepID=A0A401IN02_APHSA|nr:sialidase family protein [Aphanothece sacrum]GBF82644.1 alpha-sialidase [Aphanothece sacrum FPU1]GBF86175.1 alpha-sialidase [Aphanothece sacrum FPU3]
MKPYLINRRCFLALSVGAAGTTLVTGCFNQPLEKVKVYTGGKDGYHTYRIPSLLCTPSGNLLAFCEGRKQSQKDSGKIDLLLKRSQDGGKTWSKQQIIWENGDNVCGNPCPVFDQTTGKIYLLMTGNLGSDHEQEIIEQTSKGTRTVWVCSSQDEGKTWSKPVEITPSVKQPDWTWYATGPGVGIQLQKNDRLVIPCNHCEAESKKYYSHIFYSDDHGQTWKLGGSSPSDRPGMNECQVVELANGSLMLNMRNQNPSPRKRGICLSKDQGLSWSNFSYDSTLIDPTCQASFLRYIKPNQNQEGKLIFSNPASQKERINLTVRLSKDEGKTWPVSRQIDGGPSAYSCLTILPDLSIGCLYECGKSSPYEHITFVRFQF